MARHQASVEAFRRQATTKRGSSWSLEPFTLREKVVLGGVLFAYFFLLWMASGLIWYWQAAATGVAVVGFSTLFWPLPGDRTGDVGSPRQNARALLQHPVFWLGVLLLSYMLISAYNIRVEPQVVAKGLRLHTVEHIEWLPSSVLARIDKDNPLKFFLLFANSWLLTCALAVGLRNRRAWRMCLGWLAIGLLVWLAGAFYMDFMRFERVLGIWKPSRYQYPLFFGTIVAKAHVGYFMSLATALCLSLFFLYWRQARQRGQHAGPHWIFFLGALLFTVAEVRIFDRGPLAYLIGVWAFALLLFCITSIRERQWGGLVVIGVLMAAGLGGSVYLTEHSAYGAQEKNYKRELRQMREDLANWRMIDRVRATEVALEMWQERKFYGWGAGSFRYCYLTRLDEYPDLVYYKYRGTFDRDTGEWKNLDWTYYHTTGKLRPKKHRVTLNAVHNDWAQFLVELGLVGFGLLFAVVACWYFKVLWHLRRLDAAGWMLLAGTTGMLLTALIDFHHLTPSIHSFTALMIVCTARWAEVKDQAAVRKKRRRRGGGIEEAPEASDAAGA